MHGYSTDSNERRYVPLFLAALAIALAWVSSRLLIFFRLSIPWWLDAPSTLGLYGLFYTLFDKYLWRGRVLHKLGISKIPNLAGCWRGFLLSSFDRPAKRHDVMLQIFQSWTHISVYLTTATSISRSCAAVVEVSDPDSVALVYQYENQPLADAMKTMHMHYGTAVLRISGDTLTGEYYAGRDRRTYGRICCWKNENRGSQVLHLSPVTRDPSAIQ